MAADDIPDPQGVLRLARRTMSSAERRRKYRRLDFMDASFWYRTQLAFFAAGGSGLHQRLIYGGNQTGKTLSCAAEVSWHATGAYPDWWTGKRYDKPIRGWVVGESSTLRWRRAALVLFWLSLICFIAGCLLGAKSVLR